MKLTNKYGLPDGIVRAVANDSYSKGESDFSVTELLKPPCQTSLQLKHGHEVEEDVSDRIWSLLGQAAHSVCERANQNDLTETRFFSKFGEYTLSGQIDTFGAELGKLSDYKVTSIYKANPFKPTDKDFVAQMNMQRELMLQNKDKIEALIGRPLEIKQMEIIAILRDWSKRKARTEQNYPPLNVAVLPVEIWPREKTVAYINERIQLHLEYRNKVYIPRADEIWADPDRYAVMKNGGKKASRVYDTLAEAQLFVDQDPKNFTVQVRHEERKRCIDYCSVNKWCSTYQATLKKQSSEDVA